METWRPASESEVLRILEIEIAELRSDHRRRFNDLRVPLRSVPVAGTDPPELVFIVAEVGNRVIYYEDVEEGFEVSSVNDGGEIPERGCNQFDLTHVMHRLEAEGALEP